MRAHSKGAETVVLRPPVTTMLAEGQTRGRRDHGLMSGFYCRRQHW
jgi:hypothetical protein